MRINGLTASIACAVAFALGFWLYGLGRTMCETVGLSVKGCACGGTTGLVPAALVAVCVAPFLRRRGRALAGIGIIVGALLLGAIASELRILHDELAFAEQVKTFTRPYSRARAWPNESASLVFVPGRGIHSTD